MIFEFLGYVLDIDVDKTRAYYDATPFDRLSPCDGFRNYEKAMDLMPQWVISFFAQLGIEAKKPCEVFARHTNMDNSVACDGWYHVCGKMISGESAIVSVNPEVAYLDVEKTFAVADDFRAYFQEKCYFLPEDFPLPALQLEIIANIPWVLEKRNPYSMIKERIKMNKFKRLWFKLRYRNKLSSTFAISKNHFQNHTH